ncbi:MAG: retropepsin-like aspartic protease [Prevotella sp.]|uniref:retropepsin-like aspartic protease family protein n=1 Tax=Prevotella sp. TaxID=59823 RepID=UPI002A2DA306|nr:retropepsin-like aspartic protease [Prevotella sp.]MDD7317773.1 retropepsin-like aspartic protease [Prevotellaceae bacterium]MDY4020688.1 retropepsin-like aspartic protease [Prevotella sp.]
MRKVSLFIIAAIALASCQYRPRGGGERPHRSNDTESETRPVHSGKPQKIKMQREGGVIVMPATVNGVPMKFVFDTGASSITISQTEAQFLAKQGLLTEKDIVGMENFRTADGSLSEGTVIRLKEVKIGNHVITNVEAAVIETQNAPLLLGQTVLSKFGKVSLDYKNGYLIFE